MVTVVHATKRARRPKRAPLCGLACARVALDDSDLLALSAVGQTVWYGRPIVNGSCGAWAHAGLPVDSVRASVRAITSSAAPFPLAGCQTEKPREQSELW